MPGIGDTGGVTSTSTLAGPAGHLTPEDWQSREAAHQARVDALTAGRRERAARGRAHPVEDFLFEYYRYSPAQLRRWHPGAGVTLADAARMPRAAWRWYRTTGADLVVDHTAYLRERAETVGFVRGLLSATAARAPRLRCFGMHEWAMVYRLPQEDVRHASWPLRLGTDGTDAVVESHSIACSHFDAFRFFTTDAVPRNAIQPRREKQMDLEQPGCLHAGMDLYKWAFKLTPLMPSTVTVAAFELAREIRHLDMAASPYDLSTLGITPVLIETAEGKADYVAQQRAFAERSNAMRAQLLAILDAATDQ